MVLVLRLVFHLALRQVEDFIWGALSSTLANSEGWWVAERVAR